MPNTETSSFQSETVVLRPRLHACAWYPRSNCSTERYEIQQGDWLSQPGNEFYTLVSPKGCGKETVVCICCLLKAPVSQCDLALLKGLWDRYHLLLVWLVDAITAVCQFLAKKTPQKPIAWILKLSPQVIDNLDTWYCTTACISH